MVQKKNEIHNSTFNESVTVLANRIKLLWNDSSSSTSISSIEQAFHPTEIKKAVNFLVMSKYGSHYSDICSKFSTRKSKYHKISFNSDSSDVNSDTGETVTESSSERSENSIGTRSLSKLISNFAPAGDSSSVEYLSLIQNSKTDDCYSSKTTIGSLNKKLLVLGQNKEQILKAIHYHTIHKSAGFIKERLEAEKLLLITDIKTDLLVFLNNEELFYDEDDSLYCSGTVEIFNVHYWPKELDHFDQYYVCLIIHGSKVHATEVSKVKANGMVTFNKKFVECFARSDFKLRIRIYSISLKALKKPTKLHLSCNYDTSQDEDNFPIRKSLFTLCGETDLEFCDLNKEGRLQIDIGAGLFTASVTSQANLNFNLSGFLNVNPISATRPLWNRQWCTLNGKFLKFFNYPQFDLNNCDPTDSIDLTTCVELRPLSREECARKQTFLLKLRTGKSVLLSCDSQHDFEYWTNYLKIALGEMRKWEDG